MGCWFSRRWDIDRGMVQKAANTSDTLERTSAPSGHANRAGSASDVAMIVT
jgi:hypothetical protein